MAVTILLLTVLAVTASTGEAVACGGSRADVVFILDSSGSVGATNYQDVLKFAQNITGALDVGEDKVRIGCVRYSSTSSIIFNLDTYYEKDNITAAIGGMSYVAGRTQTDDAIQQFREESILTSNGGRNDTLKIGILVTDGISSQAGETITQANLTHLAGHYLIAVGVGNADDTELNAIASDPDDEHVFHVTDFTNLQDVEDAIVEKVCYVSEGTPCYTEACLEQGNWGKPIDNGVLKNEALTATVLSLVVLFLAL